MRELEEALSAILSSARVEDLTGVMQRLTHQHGFPSFSYMDVRGPPRAGEPEPFCISSVDTAFRSTYMQEGLGSHDPVLARAKRANAPFTWDVCSEFHSPGIRRRGPKTRARKVMEVAFSFGYTQGLTIPACTKDMYGALLPALVTLYWTGAPEEMSKRAPIPWWLPIAVEVYHKRVVELRGLTSDNPPQPPSFTDRERDCLVWACRGKTNAVTATILGIQERTVEHHIQEAMKKLGVHSKIHAAAVAVSSSLITL
ncbi:helix-turn-helix transcriptional regulator [Archangium lansingense]|uniref:helix-turn-helix transcriptional regulator n=1 Tax=Archangium lansingense TaxID=2995310 RepID=UPI003B7E3FB4